MQIRALDKWRHVLTRSRCEEQVKMLLQQLERYILYTQGRTDRIEAACRITQRGLNMSDVEQHTLSLGWSFQDIRMRPGSASLSHPEQGQCRAESHLELRTIQACASIPGKSAAAVPSSSVQSKSRDITPCIAVRGSVVSTGDKSTNDLSPAITEQKVLNVVKESLRLRPSARLASHVMRTREGPSCSTEDVGEEISLDQALSVPLLKMVNSSAHRRGLRVGGVKVAVTQIGIQTMGKLLTVLNILSRYGGVIGRCVYGQLVWEYSIWRGLTCLCGRQGLSSGELR